MAKQLQPNQTSELQRAEKLLQEALAIIAKLTANSEPPTPLPLQNLVVYLNAGHGNVHPQTGKYMTFPQDGKFYQFTEAGKVIFTAYEGQTNRIFADQVALKLVELGAEVVKVYHPIEDRLNQDRLFIANSHWAKAKQAGKRGLWLSFHSNAVGISHQGASQEPRGLCIFTSAGKTESDQFAQVWLQNITAKTKPFGITNRGLLEADFYELTGSAMPAVLIENLFFTNIEDAKLLINPDYQQAITEATINALLSYYSPNA
jgi:N-acetylmuramoyl-L-alanine amidase